MEVGEILLVWLFLFCREGASSFHGNLKKVILSNENYSERKIEEQQFVKLVQPVHDKYFILIHDEDINQLFDQSEWYEQLSKVLLSKYPKSAVFETFWSWNGFVLLSPSPYMVKEVALDYLFLYNLLMDNGVEAKKIVVIGHGYGALIGSEAAKAFEKIHGVTIDRLVALDPAEIYSILTTNQLYITRTKADVVMVIHTTEGPKQQPDGTIDFFPNGGYAQPGCTFLLMDICGNRRSFEYFIAAVSYPEHFRAYKCGSYGKYKQGNCDMDPVSMGDLETTETGIFYLETNSSPPFFKI